MKLKRYCTYNMMEFEPALYIGGCQGICLELPTLHEIGLSSMAGPY